MPYAINNQRDYQRQWMRSRRDAWLMERFCVACGSIDDLEVDHVDPSTKSMNPAQIWSRSEPDRIRELAKCQALCAACHDYRTWWQRVTLDHGLTRYRNGCRCRTCKDSQSMKARAYRANHAKAVAGVGLEPATSGL